MEPCFPNVYILEKKRPPDRVLFCQYSPTSTSRQDSFRFITRLFPSVQYSSPQQLSSSMHLDKHGYVSIAELVVYIPCLILGFLVCHRHGFKRTSGWIFVLILSAIRIAGS